MVESVIGAWLLKRQGLATLGKISTAVEGGRVPSSELIDGLLILVAGALMLAPGFIGDILGFLLLIPLTRAPFRSPLHKRFESGKYGQLLRRVGSRHRAAARFVGTLPGRGGGLRHHRLAGRPSRPRSAQLDP